MSHFKHSIISRWVTWTLFIISTVVGNAQPTKNVSIPEFEVASVKASPFSNRGGLRFGGNRGRIDYRDVTFRELLAKAFRLQLLQIRGPSWIDSKYYAISATVPPGTDASLIPEMLQRLLSERFDLRLHTEKPIQSVYTLTVSPNEPLKIQVSPPEAPPIGIKESDGTLVARAAKMEGLCAFLTLRLGRPVVDQTGLSERYDFEASYSVLELSTPQGMGLYGSITPDGKQTDSRPSIFRALQNLGLILRSGKAPSNVLVVDSASPVPKSN